MPLDEPSWWYGSPSDDWRARALQPVAKLYGWATERRFAKAHPFRARVPIVCVGNFTAGGTGKTPMSLLIADMLTELGERPAFLSRGYSGKQQGPAWVSPERHRSNEVGDEPLLLAAAHPTLVSRDRVAGARTIAVDEPSATVIIMDDGLQNPALEKDLRIAVVDGIRGIGNGQLIPSGPLRAPLPFQFAMTDVVVVNTPPGSNNEGNHADQPGSVLARLRQSFPGPVLSVTPEPAGDTSWLREAPVIAFAGIANPGRFFRLLESLGAQLLARHEFRDHHRFTESEAERLLQRASAMGAQLVTTEKDLVRLGRDGSAMTMRLRQATRALPIRLRFSDGDRTRMVAQLEALTARRDKPAAT